MHRAPHIREQYYDVSTTMCRASRELARPIELHPAGTSDTWIVSSLDGRSVRDSVHLPSQLDVQRGNATRVVGREIDDDAVPNIEPFGMVLHRLRDQRDAREATIVGSAVIARLAGRPLRKLAQALLHQLVEF